MSEQKMIEVDPRKVPQMIDKARKIVGENDYEQLSNFLDEYSTWFFINGNMMVTIQFNIAFDYGQYMYDRLNKMRKEGKKNA